MLGSLIMNHDSIVCRSRYGDIVMNLSDYNYDAGGWSADLDLVGVNND